MSEILKLFKDESSSVGGCIIRNKKDAQKAERKYRAFSDSESVPFSKGTPYDEIAEIIYPDRDGPWKNTLYLCVTKHTTTIGVQALSRRTKEFLNELSKDYPMDILSVTAGMAGDYLCSIFLVRCYTERPNFGKIFEYLGETRKLFTKEKKSHLEIPDDAFNNYTEEDYIRHDELRAKQDFIYQESDEEVPFLNRIDHYVCRELTEIDESKELTYDLLTRDMQTYTILPYRDFIRVFQSCMSYVSGVEKDTYYAVVRGVKRKEEFDRVMDSYIQKNFINTKILPIEDLPALQKKLDRALFELYIVQDLIDDPEISDIKITAPDSIRVRVGGKAYLSNVTFIGLDDYMRFINSIAVKNNVDMNLPAQTFTDENDENFILRFAVTSPYISGTGLPVIHIRKLDRRKKMAPDLIAAGMFDEKVRDYLIDKGRDRDSKGIVFAGPPGSGKTTCLNWFLEDAYEQSAEILVIQENDELFAMRKGVTFQHVVSNPQKGEKACSLEELGQLALVAGANVFIIGEAKGGEISSAITLSNSGCRTAITIHSTSSKQTIDKMADLSMRGIATSYEQAKRNIVSFRTIVYMEDYKIKEITEVVGTDKQGFPIYKIVYKNPYFDKKKNKRREDF